ncbi:MAG: tetratricopeptide repeat protein, partial [Acidobacteriota bacterium]
RRALARAQRRRRRFAVASGVAAVTLLIVSIFAAQAHVARRAAEQRQAQAEGLIDFMLGDLRRKLEPIGRLAILDDVGDRAMAYFAGVPESALSDGELLRRTEALAQIGAVRLDQGRLPEAIDAFQRALALADDLVARRPDDDARRFGLAQSHYWVGYVHYRQRRFDRARDAFEAYLDLAGQLVARAPDRAAWQLELAYAHSNLASVHEAQDALDATLEALQQARAIVARLLRLSAPELSTTAAGDDDASGNDADGRDLPPEPSRDALQLQLAHLDSKLASVLEGQGRLDDARARYVDALASHRALAEAHPDDARHTRHVATIHNHLGDLALIQGEIDAALNHFRADLAGAAQLVARDPDNAAWAHELGISYEDVARALAAAGADDAARDAFDRAVSIHRDLVARDATQVTWQLSLARARIARAAARDALDADARTELRAVQTALDALLSTRPDDVRITRLAADAAHLLHPSIADSSSGEPP